MRIVKVISCAVLCVFIIIFSCLPALAAETAEPTKPKNYSQMTEAELLANNQIPIDYIIKTIQKQIDKTVKDDDGKEIRLYEFFKYVKQEDGTTKTEKIPVGKFNLLNFLQDKKIILDYYVPVDNEDKSTFKKLDKERVYIKNLYIFDSVPFIDTEYSNTAKSYSNYEQGAFLEVFRLYSKPSYILKNTSFYTLNENTVNQSFNIKNGSWTADRPNGIMLALSHLNAQVLSSGLSPLSYQRSFYMNFMPEGGDGLLNNFVVTDKDISSEKQYIDDPDRPDGNYKYGIYEFQDDVMTMAQYFEEQPEVIPSKVGSMTNYTTKHKGKSYVWDVAKNTFTDFSAEGWNTRTTELFKDYPSTNTIVKFSWKPFDNYNGEIYQDNTVLVDGNGWVAKRPIGSYPYVMKHYVNGQVYETFYFMYKPYVSIHDVKMDYKTKTTTAKIFVDSEGSAGMAKSNKNQLLWYSKRQDVFFVPYSSIFKVDPLKETYTVNLHYRDTGQKTGEYVTFNWDAGAEYEKWFELNPYDKSDGSDLDSFYEEEDEIITDDEGNPVGQGDGSKPGKDDTGGFEFGDFEFNSESLWKYATQFLNFCAKAFAILPSFIWQIIATGAVVVVVLRILSR